MQPRTCLTLVLTLLWSLRAAATSTGPQESKPFMLKSNVNGNSGQCIISRCVLMQQRARLSSRLTFLEQLLTLGPLVMLVMALTKVCTCMATLHGRRSSAPWLAKVFTCLSVWQLLLACLPMMLVMCALTAAVHALQGSHVFRTQSVAQPTTMSQACELHNKL